MYKMAVLDIDGTTLNSSGKFSKNTAQTIQRLNEKGVPVCLCTGRNVAHTIPVIKKLNIKTPFTCIDGKVMYDLPGKKIIYENKLGASVARDLIEFVAGKHAYIEAITPFNYLRHIKSADLFKYNYNGQSSLLKDMLISIRYFKNISKLKSYSDDIFEIIVGGSMEVLDDIKNALNGEDIDINTVWEKYLIISPNNGRKCDGVKALCSHYNIDMSDVVAIGDETNDLEMLKMAGMGVAMGNATDMVKNVADYITADNDNDGAALALQKFFGV